MSNVMSLIQPALWIGVSPREGGGWQRQGGAPLSNSTLGSRPPSVPFCTMELRRLLFSCLALLNEEMRRVRQGTCNRRRFPHGWGGKMFVGGGGVLP